MKLLELTLSGTNPATEARRAHFKAMDNGNCYRSRVASESLSDLIAGIDKDIKRIFLDLPLRKLTKVFVQYGELYGVSKVIYAKNTYPKWQSGQTAMSGIMVARLLNLVPLVLDADDVYELVKKIRNAYLRQQCLTVECHTIDWFRKLPPVVEGLVGYSNQFELPENVIEKLHWLTIGNGRAAQELLAAAEVEEATVRTQYLNREYAHIARMLSGESGMSEFRHTIELPQGTIAVTITKPPFNFLERMPLVRVKESSRKRALSIICKNPSCGAELETTLSAYDGEPFDCTSSELTCCHCGVAFVYAEQDLKRTRRNLNVEIRRGFFGGYTVKYDCPLCGVRLNNPLNESGAPDTCPKCKTEFVVPRS